MLTILRTLRLKSSCPRMDSEEALSATIGASATRFRLAAGTKQELQYCFEGFLAWFTQLRTSSSLSACWHQLPGVWKGLIGRNQETGSVLVLPRDGYSQALGREARLLEGQCSETAHCEVCRMW